MSKTLLAASKMEGAAGPRVFRKIATSNCGAAVQPEKKYDVELGLRAGLVSKKGGTCVAGRRIQFF